MNEHTRQNLKIHNEILRAGFTPIPGNNKPGDKKQQSWCRLAKDFVDEWKKKGYDKKDNDQRLNGGEWYNNELAKVIGTMRADDDALNKIYGGKDTAVNILLDGKLALLDFDDADNPELYKAFEEEYPFLLECYRDVNIDQVKKKHSVHYLIPDDDDFQSGGLMVRKTGQITSQGNSSIHLLHPKVDRCSVKVDFKKLSGGGRLGESTTEGGCHAPTISTFSQRVKTKKLPRYSKYKKIKEMPSYKKFKKYMARVYELRKEKPVDDHHEVHTAITKVEQSQIEIKKYNHRTRTVEDFKKLPVFKFIQENYPEEEGFKYTITGGGKQPFMIDLGKAECARECPFASHTHKHNNMWLLYKPTQQKLEEWCFGCSGKNRPVDWKDVSNYEKEFWRAAGGKEKVHENRSAAEEALIAGKHAIAELLNNHLCYIDKLSKSEYILYNYGYQYCVKDDTGLKSYYRKWSFTPKIKYWLAVGGDPQGTKKELFDTPRKLIPSECWLEYPKQHRRCYKGFTPSEGYDDRGRMFNTFQGFAITKDVAEAYMRHKNIKPEDVEKLIAPVLDHIREIWCNNKQNRFDYVMNWFAQVIQKPTKKTRVALCLKSDFEGAGKSVIVGILKSIIGDFHSVSLNDFPKDFNDILADKCFINLDEAIWGLRGSAAKVKTFITENTQQIRRKFKDEYTQEAFHNVLLSTNEAFMCPKDIGSRRYYILDLCNKYAGIMTEEKRAHFKPIWDIAKEPEVFAYYLYTRDISNYDPTEFEETEAGLAVAELGASNISMWFYRCLKDDEFHAEFAYDAQGVRTEMVYRSGMDIPKHYLWQSYCKYTHNDPQSQSRETHFWRELWKLTPKEKCCVGQKSEFNRRHCVNFNLEDARQAFTNGWVAGEKNFIGTSMPFDEELDTTVDYDIKINDSAPQKIDYNDNHVPKLKVFKNKTITLNGEQMVVKNWSQSRAYLPNCDDEDRKQVITEKWVESSNDAKGHAKGQQFKFKITGLAGQTEFKTYKLDTFLDYIKKEYNCPEEYAREHFSIDSEPIDDIIGNEESEDQDYVVHN